MKKTMTDDIVNMHEPEFEGVNEMSEEMTEATAPDLLNWEQVFYFYNKEDDFLRITSRARVDGGFLYSEFIRLDKNINTTLCFVPDSVVKKLPKKKRKATKLVAKRKKKSKAKR